MGDTRTARTHRVASRGAPSPASSQDQGTGIAHSGSKERCERPSDVTEHERAAYCRNDQMSSTLNQPASVDGVMTSQLLAWCAQPATTEQGRWAKNLLP